MVDKNFTGYLTVANPKNFPDEWTRSVLLLVSHTPDITIGVQINKPYSDLTLAPVALRLGVEDVPDDPIYIGGDSQPHKIHVIHSLDWQGLTTIPLNNYLGITNDISILSAMALGQGPKWTRACAGFKMWEDGVFDLELNARVSSRNKKSRSWSIAPATVINTFDQHLDTQWQQVLEESAKFAVDLWFAD